jgi:hypothetical protein
MSSLCRQKYTVSCNDDSDDLGFAARKAIHIVLRSCKFSHGSDAPVVHQLQACLACHDRNKPRNHRAGVHHILVGQAEQGAGFGQVVMAGQSRDSHGRHKRISQSVCRHSVTQLVKRASIFYVQWYVSKYPHDGVNERRLAGAGRADQPNLNCGIEPLRGLLQDAHSHLVQGVVIVTCSLFINPCAGFSAS